MKRQTGYYATQRRHGRARAGESAVRRASPPTTRPLRRRFVTESHAVGREVSPARLVGTAAVLVLSVVFLSIWAKRR